MSVYIRTTAAALTQLHDSREQEGLPLKSGGRSNYGLGSPHSGLVYDHPAFLAVVLQYTGPRLRSLLLHTAVCTLFCLSCCILVSSETSCTGLAATIPAIPCTKQNIISFDWDASWPATCDKNDGLAHPFV